MIKWRTLWCWLLLFTVFDIVLGPFCVRHGWWSRDDLSTAFAADIDTAAFLCIVWLLNWLPLPGKNDAVPRP